MANFFDEQKVIFCGITYIMKIIDTVEVIG